MSSFTFNGKIIGDTKIVLNENSQVTFEDLPVKLNGKLVQPNGHVYIEIKNGVLIINTETQEGD